MNNRGIIQKTKDIIANDTDFLIGFANLKDVKGCFDYKPSLPVGITIALPLNPRIVKDIDEGPTKEYYDYYYEVQEQLDSISSELMDFIKGQGYQAIAQTSRYVSENCTKMGTFRTYLPQKTVAVGGGLGWIGKSDLLVSEKYGSAIRLTSVLTDAPLECNRDIYESKCGNCKECQKACPAGAINGEMWQPAIDRDQMVDVVKCRNQARKLSKENFGKEVSLCGKCFNVCPYTRRYIKGV